MRVELILTGSKPAVLTVTPYIPNIIGIEPIQSSSQPPMLTVTSYVLTIARI